MRSDRLDAMTGGWFVGPFTPSVLPIDGAEVAVKSYRRGATEPLHVHRVATEVTLVVSGRIRMADQDWGPGDIIVVDPGESSAFAALTDATTVVVKSPAVVGDKYLVEK